MKTFGRIILIISSVGVALYGWHFLDFEVKGILRDRGELAYQLKYLAGFYAHVLFGPIALLTGAFQFAPKFRAKNLSLHRFLGKIYVLACILGGIAGFYIAFFSYSLIATLGFISLALFWLYTTTQAYLTIRKKEVIQHRIWMHRSFALTLSAVTLRVYLGIMAGFTDWSIETIFSILGWICWVPNLIVVEAMMRSDYKNKEQVLLNWA